MSRRFHFHQTVFRLFLPLWLVSIACSTLTSTPPPESSYRYDELPGENNEDAAVSEYRTISKWDKTEIRYFFINGTSRIQEDRERDLLQQAFALWAEKTPMTFTEVSSSSQADIVIGWAAGSHGDGDPFDGPGDVLAHASFPNPYDDRQVFLHFDDDERWVDSASQDVDLLTVAAHEIGHTLGLGHSNDPRALMYPSYTGPHRFLSDDDVAGAQDLYGVASAQPSAPDVPKEDTPPDAENDSDNDGISDRDEILVTGTDPDKTDSDGDGLGDGVEVLNRMNPLDADMDKDGVNDGQEVANGTNPFFPDNASISPELEEEISDFLTKAIELQMEAYRKGNASIASSIMAGEMFESFSADIDSLNQRGLVAVSQIDYYESYINDIRVISNTFIEVDTCEVWTTSVYSQADGSLIQSDDPALLPQTITIQQLNNGWFITQVDFFDAPSFCE